MSSGSHPGADAISRTLRKRVPAISDFPLLPAPLYSLLVRHAPDLLALAGGLAIAALPCRTLPPGSPPPRSTCCARSPTTTRTFRHTPSPADWRDAPIYQIMTDRFEDGDPSNNGLRGWFGAGDRKMAQGGDWRGITRQLDYLRQLGVKTIWISCVHRNHSFDEKWKPYHAYHPTDLLLGRAAVRHPR